MEKKPPNVRWWRRWWKWHRRLPPNSTTKRCSSVKSVGNNFIILYLELCKPLSFLTSYKVEFQLIRMRRPYQTEPTQNWKNSWMETIDEEIEKSNSSENEMRIRKCVGYVLLCCNENEWKKTRKPFIERTGFFFDFWELNIHNRFSIKMKK